MPTRKTRKRPTGVKARTRVIRKGKLYKPTKKTRVPLVITQCNDDKERRHNMAPIGRPPKDPQARKRYNELKREETPYEKKLQERKEKKAAARAQKRIENAEAKAKARFERQQRRRQASHAKTRAAIEKDEALDFYQGWSINELRADCKDYGISDYRRDWMRYPERPSIRDLGYPYRLSPRSLRMAVWIIEDGIMLSYFPNTIYGPPDLLGRVEDLSYYFRHQR